MNYLSIPPFIYWISGIVFLGLVILTIIFGKKDIKNKQPKKERSKTASQIHGEISQKILSDEKLKDHYFGSIQNCTRSTERK